MKKRNIGRGATVLLGAALVACLVTPLASAANLSSSSFSVRAQNSSDSSLSAIKPLFKATSTPTTPPTTAPPATDVPSPVTDFTWSTTATAATVVSYKGNATKVVIPSTYNSLPVTALSSKILGTLPVQSVVIPDSITSIANNAFMFAYSLKSVSLPNGLTTIGTFAFYGDPIESLTIPSTVTAIGANAFLNNMITSLVIPDSVTSMGNYAFNNGQISSLKLSANLKVIPQGAFASSPLKTVTIPSAVTAIGDSAFDGTALTSVYMEGNAPAITAAGSSVGTFGSTPTTGKKIYYKAGATGYSNPWGGYATATY